MKLLLIIKCIFCNIAVGKMFVLLMFDFICTLVLCYFITLPDILVSGLRFYCDSSIFFTRYPPSSLNGTQPKLATCSEVSAI